MPIERKKIRSALVEKGFVEVTKKKDHDFYYLHVGGRKTSVFTKLSRGTGYREYPDNLVRNVYRQIGLNKSQFIDYVDCLLTEDAYIEELRQQRRIR